jgi:penicillin amidase
MKKWQGTNNLKMLHLPFTTNGFIYLKNTFEDELGTEGFKRFLQTHVMKQVVAKQISNESSCGGITVPKLKKETRVEIITKSFKEAIFLENQLGESVESWTWDKVHVVVPTPNW